MSYLSIYLKSAVQLSAHWTENCQSFQTHHGEVVALTSKKIVCCRLARSELREETETEI